MLMFVPGGCSNKEWPLAFDHDFLCFGHTILFLLDSYRVYANFQHCLSVSDTEVIRRKHGESTEKPMRNNRETANYKRWKIVVYLTVLF